MNISGPINEYLKKIHEMQSDGLKSMRIKNKGGRERQNSLKSILKERSLNNRHQLGR